MSKQKESVLMSREDFDLYRRYVSLGDMAKPSEQDFFKNEIVDVKSLATLAAAAVLSPNKVTKSVAARAIGKITGLYANSGATKSLAGLVPTLGYGAGDLKYFLSRAFGVAFSLKRTLPLYVIVPVRGSVAASQFDSTIEADYPSLSSKIMTLDEVADDDDLGLSSGMTRVTYLMEGKFSQEVNILYVDVSEYEDIDMFNFESVSRETTNVSDNLADHSVNITLNPFHLDETECYVLIAPPHKDIQFERGGRALSHSDSAWGYLDKNNFEYWRLWIQTGLNAVDDPLEDKQSSFRAHRINPAFFYMLPFIEDVLFRKLTGKWGRHHLYPAGYPYEEMRQMLLAYENTGYKVGTTFAIVADAAANATRDYYDNPDGRINSVTRITPASCFGSDEYCIHF